MMFNCVSKYSLVTLCLMGGVLAIGVLDHRIATAKAVDGWQVEGMHGEIAVSGVLTDSPCVLSMDSEEQSVTLDPVPTYQLRHVGDLSSPVALHVQLTGCGSLGNNIRDNLHEESLSYFPDQLTSFVTFNGVEDASGDHLFKTFGDASGVALRLEDPTHQQLIPGEHSRGLVLEQGNTDLVLYAMLERTPPELKEGKYGAVVNFNLSYQ